MEERNILAFRIGGIGDGIVALPALSALRKTLPNSRLVLATQSWIAELLEEEKIADEFIVFDSFFLARKKNLLNLKVWQEFLRLSRCLLKQKWDILFLLHPLDSLFTTIKPFLVALFSRSPIRVGMDSQGRGFFLTHKLHYNPYERGHNNAELLAETVELLGIRVKERKPRLNLTENEKHRGEMFLKEMNWKGSLLIGFCPTGRLKTRWWDWDRYVEVLRWIEKEYKDCYFLLTIGRNEWEAERFFREKLGEKLIAARGLPIRHLAGIIQGCSLFISNDTGPMHLAFAVGVPTIGLFGPGEWQKWAYNDKNFFAIHHMVDCWPCYKEICDRGHICMKKISVDEVIEKVKIALERRWEDRS
jgi:heptosyltransferase-2